MTQPNMSPVTNQSGLLTWPRVENTFVTLLGGECPCIIESVCSLIGSSVIF